MKMQDQLILTSIQKEELKLWIQNCITETLTNKKEEEILSKEQTATFLGVSRVTLTTWMKTGKIPFSRVGGRVYFKKTILINAMKDIHIKGRK